MVEVMFASSLALLLFLVLIETLSVCRRIAADLKWRMAADAVAYDVGWDLFNRKTSWFESVTEAQAAWVPIATNRTSVWLGDSQPYYYYSILPVGDPPVSWQINVDVKWPLPDGGFGQLAQPYLIERFRSDRNLFRKTL